jgi:hypothetical protein
MRFRALIVLAVIAVLIVVAAAVVGRRRYGAYLSGFWVGDPGFLARARLSEMQLFLGPPSGGGREGYLIVKDLAGELIWCDALTARVRGDLARPYRGAATFEFDSSDGAEPPLPADLNVALSVMDGSLTLHSDSEVYAFFRKDFAASAVALAAYEDE